MCSICGWYVNVRGHYRVIFNQFRPEQKIMWWGRVDWWKAGEKETSMVSHPVATTADNNTDLIRVGQGTHWTCAHSQPSISSTHKHNHAHTHLIPGFVKGDAHSGGKMTYSKVRKSTLPFASFLSLIPCTCMCVYVFLFPASTLIQVFQTLHISLAFMEMNNMHKNRELENKTWKQMHTAHGLSLVLNAIVIATLHYSCACTKKKKKTRARIQRMFIYSYITTLKDR